MSQPIGVARLPTRMAEAAGKATDEWRASLLAKVDWRRIWRSAAPLLSCATRVQRSQAFRETVRLDPQRVEAWTMIARIHAATGNLDGVRAALDDVLAANPSTEVL